MSLLRGGRAEINASLTYFATIVSRERGTPAPLPLSYVKDCGLRRGAMSRGVTSSGEFSWYCEKD